MGKRVFPFVPRGSKNRVFVPTHLQVPLTGGVSMTGSSPPARDSCVSSATIASEKVTLR